MVNKIKSRGTRQVLSSSEKRVTAQRALLLDLIKRSNEHLDADELYRKARYKYPRISLSTVYRNLQVFEHIGLIEKHHFDEEHHHYEVKPATEHQHLLCLGCGKVVEFSLPSGRKFQAEVAGKFNFEISEVEIHMAGLCSACSREKQEKHI